MTPQMDLWHRTHYMLRFHYILGNVEKQQCIKKQATEPSIKPSPRVLGGCRGKQLRKYPKNENKYQTIETSSGLILRMEQI